MVHATYLELWDELYDSSENTTMIDRGLRNMPYQREFKDLIGFVIKHMDSFKTAYARSRRMLEQYVKAITTTRAGDPSAVDGVSLNSLRGWLDDSMINYLSGEPDTIHVSDRRTGKRTAYFKAVPKSRKAHIALCLALGMTRDEVCRYLRTMGYSVLSTEDPEDRRLIRELDQWDREHPWVWQYKQYRISSVPDVEMPPSFGEDNTFRGNLLTPGLERKAVNDMLELRQTLQISYQAAKKEFPYRKDA
ncbi:MAG: hypothetical protein IJH77_00280 [Mogibacterium sp.]|nr:hypothetical protein [Mogibacterium sp.]